MRNLSGVSLAKTSILGSEKRSCPGLTTPLSTVNAAV
jgi:hypothetical protein